MRSTAQPSMRRPCSEWRRRLPSASPTMLRTVVVLPMPLRARSGHHLARLDHEVDAEQHQAGAIARLHAFDLEQPRHAAASRRDRPGAPRDDGADLVGRAGDDAAVDQHVMRSARRNTASMSCSTSRMVRCPARAPRSGRRCGPPPRLPSPPSARRAGGSSHRSPTPGRAARAGGARHAPAPRQTDRRGRRARSPASSAPQRAPESSGPRRPGRRAPFCRAR